MELKRILRESVVSIVIISIFGVSYAALSSLTATSGEALTEAKWNALVEHAVPSTAVMAFNASSCPTGWSAADGSAGNPDLRGEFIRGLDEGRGVDSGRILNSGQIFSTNFDNLIVKVLKSDGPVGAGFWANPVANVTNSFTNQNFIPDVIEITGSDTETRPRNVALLYCVKD